MSIPSNKKKIKNAATKNSHDTEQTVNSHLTDNNQVVDRSENQKEFIFLDIDGVLNFDESPHTDSYLIPDELNPYNQHITMWIDPAPVAALDAFLNERPNAVIVVSSSWRRLMNVSHFQVQLSLAGLKNANRIIAKTSQARFSGGARGQEIEFWLHHNGHEGSPFVALDDCVGSCSVASFIQIANHLILIDHHRGFTQTDAIKAATALNSQHKKQPYCC